MSTNPFDDNRGRRTSRSSRRSRDTEPAIWAARNVEWPIPSALSLANYQKLVKASKQTAQHLGMNVATTSDAAQMDHSTEKTPSDTGADSHYYGLTGFMSRVLNTSATLEKSEDDLEALAADRGGSRPLRPPRQHCVASANGWIVAALECPSPSNQAPVLRLVSRWNVRRGGMADQVCTETLKMLA